MGSIALPEVWSQLLPENFPTAMLRTRSAFSRALLDRANEDLQRKTVCREHGFPLWHAVLLLPASSLTPFGLILSTQREPG